MYHGKPQSGIWRFNNDNNSKLLLLVHEVTNLILQGRYSCYLHFTDKETEVQRNSLHCFGFQPASSGFRASHLMPLLNKYLFNSQE